MILLGYFPIFVHSKWIYPNSLDERQAAHHMDIIELAKKHFLEGLRLFSHDQYSDAEASFREALRLVPDRVSVLTNLSAALLKQNKVAGAREFAEKAVLLDDRSSESWLNLGACLAKEKKYSEALDYYEKAITVKPGNAVAWSNRGNIFRELMRNDEALNDYQKAVNLDPDFSEAWQNQGIVLRELGRHEEALSCFDKAIHINPNLPYLLGGWINTKRILCDWAGLAESYATLVKKIEAKEKVANPFNILSMPNSLQHQKTCAEIYIKDMFPPGVARSFGETKGRSDKIKIGYFSADFHNHATSHLLVGLLERHDNSKFEILGFSFGRQTDDEMRQRLTGAFNCLIDVSEKSDIEIGNMALGLKVDIAVDLKGLTGGCRTGIFSDRIAPIQVNYLGYPGTMGADYIDYLIADPTLVPQKHIHFYTEKIVFLPYTYQANDSSKRISETTICREEAGLPSSGFVFCCFNNNYKITPDMYDVWMRILRKVDGSVLWLLEGNQTVANNLRTEAEARGVSADRVVFAKRMELADHLARHRLADLFLDTLYYNAHTTASDALWAGLPVLTKIGDTFAGRVAASLLNAVGLPELITTSLEKYELLALELATNPQKLESIKRKLAQHRTTYPLFNTALFTRHLESAYVSMWERWQSGMQPAHLYIPA